MRARRANPTKKCIVRGQYVILPLTGDVLSELCIGLNCLTTLIFRDSSDGDSQLQLAEAVTLVRGDSQIYLDGSKPGSTFDPTQLSPLLNLLGATVVEARAYHNGVLEIAFSNTWLLRIVPNGYEAWHFQSPRPGRPFDGKVTQVLIIHGDDGRLIF